jgi:hypothetical protein
MPVDALLAEWHGSARNGVARTTPSMAANEDLLHLEPVSGRRPACRADIGPHEISGRAAQLEPVGVLGEIVIARLRHEPTRAHQRAPKCRQA